MKSKCKIALILSTIVYCLLAIRSVPAYAAEPCTVTIVDEFYDDDGNLENSITRETKTVMSGSTLRNVSYEKYDGYVNYDQAKSSDAGYTKIGASCYLFNITELTDEQLYTVVMVVVILPSIMY